MIETPVWKHDCPHCVFLGRLSAAAAGWDLRASKAGVPMDNYDLYFCTQAPLEHPIVLARFGHGAHEYFAARFHEPSGQMTREAAYLPTHEAALARAFKLATDRKLFVDPTNERG